MRHDHERAVHIDDFEELLRRGAAQRARLGQQRFPLGSGANVERMDHHHSAERDLLSDLAPRAILRESLQDAILRGEFSACHHLGRTGTFGYVGGATRRYDRYIVVGARAPQRWCTTSLPLRHRRRETKNKVQ
ncbi:MAG: hypothetical protein ABJF01_00740 [bacterium]